MATEGLAEIRKEGNGQEGRQTCPLRVEGADIRGAEGSGSHRGAIGNGERSGWIRAVCSRGGLPRGWELRWIYRSVDEGMLVKALQWGRIELGVNEGALSAP